MGTDSRVARCDHRHDVHRDRAPTISDDESLGYKLGTIWAQLDDLETPTVMLGVWMLVDATAGAAVWLSIGTSGGGGSHNADEIIYDPTVSGLAADDVQEAIDELADTIGEGVFLEKADGENHTVNVVAATGATETIDLSSGNYQDFTLDDDCTFTMPAVGAGKTFTAFVRQDGTGGWVPTFTDVEWPDDTPPEWATTPDTVDIVEFVSDATVWYGFAGSGGGSGGGGPVDAEDVSIVDAGNYYTGTDVEAALQELGGLMGHVGPGLAATLVATGTAGGGLTISVTPSAAPAAGDLVIFSVTGHNVTPNAAGPVQGSGAAWTERLREDTDAGEWAAVYTKIANGTEPATYDITTSSSSATLSQASVVILNGPTTFIRSAFQHNQLESPVIEGSKDGHLIIVWLSALAAGTLWDIGYDTDITEHLAYRVAASEGAVLVASRPTYYELFPQKIFIPTASGIALGFIVVLAMVWE